MSIPTDWDMPLLPTESKSHHLMQQHCVQQQQCVHNSVKGPLCSSYSGRLSRNFFIQYVVTHLS